MPKQLIYKSPGKIEIKNYRERNISDHELRIQTNFSSPKHGTEIHSYISDQQLTRKIFNPEYRIHFRKNKMENIYPINVGNMSVGLVTDIGNKIKSFKIGDRVYGHLPVKETHIADVRGKWFNKKPPLGSSFRESHIHKAPISMSDSDIVCLDPAHFAFVAIRDANLKLGDNVAIFGMGAIGLMAIQMAKLCGCQTIIAIDPKKNRCQIAEKLGATNSIDPKINNVGLKVKDLTDKKGVDVAIDISGNYSALHEAIRSVHYSGQVVTASYYHGSSRNLSLGEEWHHTRVTVKSSMPVWGNPSREYPNWDDLRVENTVFEMMKKKLFNTKFIIDPIVHFKSSAETLKKIYDDKIDSIKLGIKF